MLFIFYRKVEFFLLLLIVASFSCSNTLNDNDQNDFKTTVPKISSLLLDKLNNGAVRINSEDGKFRVGVLYKKDKQVLGTKKLVNVDFKELNSSEILILSQDEKVQFIEEDYRVKVDLIYASKQIGARDAWADGYTGETLGGTTQKIRIAVIDTGLDENHLDFSDAGKILETANCYAVSQCVVNIQDDDHGHGTHVAGIVLGGGNSSIGDDFYIEFEDPFFAVNQGTKHYFPAQFDSTPSVGGTLKADITWEGGAGSKAYSLFMTEEESIEDAPVPIVPEQEKTLTDTGPGITLGKFGNYDAVNIPAGQDCTIVPFVFSTYTTQSALVGSKYWARVKSTAQGWGDAFSSTAGIANGSQLVAVKALGSDGAGNVSDIVRALDYIAGIAESDKIIAVNLSFSLGNGITSEIINSAVAELFELGVNVVVSAGNDQQTGATVSSPGVSPYVITVGAVNEKDELTNYSSVGNINGEVTKPDVVAPGGSIKGLDGEVYQRLGIVSAKTTYTDSYWNTTQGAGPVDPYALKVGTSQAAPMVAGLVGLMASKRQGSWSFNSSTLPKLFKMIICMSAFETGARESSVFYNEAPITPERAGGLKDRLEGYGRVCTQGALSAFDPIWNLTSTTSDNFTFGDEIIDQKTFVRKVSLSSSREYTFSMTVPAGSDYDLYLFSGTPSDTGEPVLLASSALMNNASRPGPERIVDFIPSTDGDHYIVAKWISGSGVSNFTLENSRTKPTTPTVISGVRINRNMRDKTIDVFWNTNIPAKSEIQYGATGGLELTEDDSEYKTEHSFSFPIEYDNYYYLRLISSSKGSSQASISSSTSPVYRISAVTELVKDITVEDLPLVDAGGCGSIKSVGGSNGLGNFAVLFLPVIFLLMLRFRRKFNDKGLQLSK